MKFPWNKYKELAVSRRNTLQIFITNACNLRCNGCFARNVMGEDSSNISIEEYNEVIKDFISKGGRQVNLLGGEPLLHPNVKDFIAINKENDIKTTIYTNGTYLDRFVADDFKDAKIRVSIYTYDGDYKSALTLPKVRYPIDICFMVSNTTTVDELLETVDYLENDAEGNFKTNCFFISSIRELDNPNKEFFDDTFLSMPVIEYKSLVHEFLEKYKGNMEVHVSKRGVFESTINGSDCKCRFANYFIGGKIIQCPYDVVNKKFQDDYSFETRNCQHNNTCLMSKVAYKGIK